MNKLTDRKTLLVSSYKQKFVEFLLLYCLIDVAFSSFQTNYIIRFLLSVLMYACCIPVSIKQFSIDEIIQRKMHMYRIIHYTEDERCLPNVKICQYFGKFVQSLRKNKYTRSFLYIYSNSKKSQKLQKYILAIAYSDLRITMIIQ